jgi:hypothetical protein
MGKILLRFEVQQERHIDSLLEFFEEPGKNSMSPPTFILQSREDTLRKQQVGFEESDSGSML